MRLELFDFIEQTIQDFQNNLPTYQYVEGLLVNYFEKEINENNETVTKISSRIKNVNSLKEKLIRNKFYLDYNNPKEAIDHLSDLIGLIVECRFIADENNIFKRLFDRFSDQGEDYFKCDDDPNIFLNLKMPQPQLQRNGFTIYRIDGYYVFNNQRINFELQIKSLVHVFWSEVEHELVYKNKNFVVFDSFMKNMLASIRDNLDVVDRQLEIVSKQITSQEASKGDVTFQQEGFKRLIATSINDIVNDKMNKEVGFSTDFKKCSAILSQYIYITDFLQTTNPQSKIFEYFDHLNYLSENDLDFTEPIVFEHDYHHPDPFCQIIGQYWQSILNIDYEWHVFFVMLFAIQPGDNNQDFSQFIEVIKSLIVPPSWFKSKFTGYGEIDGQNARDYLTSELANCLVENGKIEMVHEDALLKVLDGFRDYVNKVELTYPNYGQFCDAKELIKTTLHHKIAASFYR